MNIEAGNWTRYRIELDLSREDEVDLHFGRRDSCMRYEEAMFDLGEKVLGALQDAYARDRRYVMFVHGHSTSRPGQTTARSVVRSIMRSKAATPFIDRAGCIQHQTVFIAKLRD
jgi:hypothetical protein